LSKPQFSEIAVIGFDSYQSGSAALFLIDADQNPGLLL
jgi:hypothetical protein